MRAPEYSLPVPTDGRAGLARGWLWLGLFSLIAPGLLAILLVAARAPGLQEAARWTEFFQTALVLHVDLTVLVWFFAFGGVIWSIGTGRRFIAVGWAALAAAAGGAIAMAIAPFVGEAKPLLNNYVPVLPQPWFLTALAVFGLGALLSVLRALGAAFPVRHRSGGAATLHLGMVTAALAAVIAAIALIWSYLSLPESITGHVYYELLFWGGGHALQYTYTLLMLVAWLWLASAAGIPMPLPVRVVFLLVVLSFVPVLAVPVADFAFPVTSAEHIRFFTVHMQYAGGVIAAPIALALLYGWWRAPSARAAARPLRAALFASATLFGVGGVVGYLIQGVNVTIPAHYHGSILGVTVAFMGLTYYLLPPLGYGEPNRRWATLQPWLLCIGQLMHIVGLAWLGGYGVQRKVVDGVEVIDLTQRIARGVLNLGGLVAILGGLVFLIVVFRAMIRRR